MCIFSPFAYLFKQSITNSKKCNDKLIPVASLYNIPSTPVLPILSLPLKSTKHNFETVFTSDVGLRHSNITMNMQCDLVDASFFGVSAITLFYSPMNNKFNASSSVYAFFNDNPYNIV